MRQNPSLSDPSPVRSILCRLVLAAVLIPLSGCGRQEEIRSYSVPKESTKKPAAPTAPADMTKDRMLAAIVSRADQTWFFKLSGDNKAVAAQDQAFLKFIRSLRFEKGAGPAWTVPEGWAQQPGGGMRYATIKIASTGKPLELTVIPLPTPKTDAEEAALANINRWRKQLGLPPGSSTAEASNEMQSVELSDGTKVIAVNLLGNLSAGGGGMRPPFAGGGPPKSASPSISTPPTKPVNLAYDVPKGWKETPAGGMRKAGFEVQDGDAKLEITVISLPGAAGGILANINRWRDQVGLGKTTEEALGKEVRQLTVGGIEGFLVELIGPEDAAKRETILAVLTAHGGSVWFFKLKGDSKLAAREKQNFEAFVQSVRFQ